MPLVQFQPGVLTRVWRGEPRVIGGLEVAPLGSYVLVKKQKGKPMFNLSEEELKKAAREIAKASERIQARMLKDAMFGTGRAAPVISTARMAYSTTSRPGPLPLTTFRGLPPPLDVITSPFVVEKKTRSREKKRGVWRRLWDGLTNLNPWPYSPIEFYEVAVPTIMVDRRNNKIICHPTLEHEVKKVVSGGIYDLAKR